MSKVVSTVNQITTQVTTYAPAVAAGMQAAEMSTASGEDKKQAVVDAIVAGSAVAAGVANPDVAAISAMINMFASIFNSLGLFKHKAAAAIPTGGTISA